VKVVVAVGEIQSVSANSDKLDRAHVVGDKHQKISNEGSTGDTNTSVDEDGFTYFCRKNKRKVRTTSQEHALVMKKEKSPDHVCKRNVGFELISFPT
jgi:hypothetical protein